jgi:hypothetical protein
LHNTPLNTASELVAQLGAQAELLAGDHFEAALAADNQEDFQYWSLVAKAIVLLTRQPIAADSPRPVPAAESRPMEPPVHIPRRASA